MESANSELPDLSTLADRHVGISVGAGTYFYEAAQVALSRHHEPPLTMIMQRDGVSAGTRTALWDLPDDPTRASHANTDDATENAAYCVAIAAVEQEYNLRIIGRTERRSGADWYVADALNLDGIESASRLEVSGIDDGTAAQVRNRVKRKIDQVNNGEISGPALIAVISFRDPMIALVRTDDA